MQKIRFIPSPVIVKHLDMIKIENGMQKTIGMISLIKDKTTGEYQGFLPRTMAGVQNEDTYKAHMSGPDLDILKGRMKEKYFNYKINSYQQNLTCD